MKLPNSASLTTSYVRRLLAALALVAFSLSAFAETGAAVQELEPFGRALTGLLKKYEIPGAAVSIAKDGHLVYARGFGIADVETGEPVQPDSLFRVASVSKPLTAVGVLKLVEEGRVSLDTHVLRFLGRRASADVRWNDVTVRHLLQHSGGLDLESWGFDPSFPDRKTLDSLGVKLPPSRNDVLNYVLANLPLASAPGTKYAYSNIGYMFLTEVIERASGQRYESFMRDKILEPLGIVRMRIGGSLLTERQLGEVRYSDNNFDAPIFAGLPAQVPVPYGTFNLRIFESGGGWMATAPDLVRFLTSFDNPRAAILRPETVALMTARPGYVPASENTWYGLGWTILQTANGQRWDHDGALPGTSAWMFRGVSGISLAIAANHLPDDAVLEAFVQEFPKLISDTVLAVPRWPASNMFNTYFPDEGLRISDAGVVNAASQRPGVLASGSVATLFGVNLNGGTVRVNGTVVDTLWSAPGQLNVRVPLWALGKTTFQVDRHGRTSNAVTAIVESEAPGIFTVSLNGYGQAAALNQDGSGNSLVRPAAPGSKVALFATGVTHPVVTVGGIEAEVLPSDRVRGLPAEVEQIQVRLPWALPPGELPVVVRSGKLSSQGGVTLAIR